MTISEVRNMDCMEYERHYIVYTDGRIYSKKTSKFLKPVKMKTGYTAITIGRSIRTIHRIVADCFLEKVDGKHIVNHKNGVKTDNSAENLEWCNHSENAIHAYENGLYKTKPVNRYSFDGKFEKRYKSARDAEKDGYSNQNIAHCCNGKRKTHLNKTWRYASK